MSSKILITGLPGCGKTTLIKELIKGREGKFAGFLTEEIRESGARIGFEIKFTSGKSGLLARKNLDSKYRVGGYGVDLEQFDRLLDQEKMNILKSRYVIIDEIGRMELFSEKFKSLINHVLSSECLLIGTVTYKSHPFADIIKKRDDVRLIKLERKNFAKIRSQLEEAVNNHGSG